jgi:sporulation protein YlmC with PRC-barrel domain
MYPEMLRFFAVETESTRARRRKEVRFVHCAVMGGPLIVCPRAKGPRGRTNPHRALLSVPSTDPVRTLTLFTGMSHLCGLYSGSKDAETRRGRTHMAQRAHSWIGFVKLSDSDFVLENPEQDIRGKEVHDPEGQRVGGVDDLYIDREEREVRFLEVGAGGVLGIGEKRFLVPVEAVTKVAEGRVTIEPGRTERVAGPAPFDTKVAPPRAADRRNDDDALLPFGNAEGTVDHRGGYGYHSSPPVGRRPFL